MEQNRWKSPVLWTAIVAQLVSILLLVGAIDVGLGDTVNQVAGIIAQILTAIGVFNNPTDAAGW